MLASQLNAISNGDSNAFGALFRCYQPRMVSYATGLLAGDRSAAEDVVDEAMIAVWQQAGRYAGRGSADGWLHRIVRNKAVDWLRKSRIGSQSDGGSDAGFADVADDAPNPEEIASHQYAADAMRRAIGVLSVKQREAVWLCYFEERSLAEIAELCGCPESTVKTRLFHARRILRENECITLSNS